MHGMYMCAYPAVLPKHLFLPSSSCRNAEQLKLRDLTPKLTLVYYIVIIILHATVVTASVSCKHCRYTSL